MESNRESFVQSGQQPEPYELGRGVTVKREAQDLESRGPSRIRVSGEPQHTLWKKNQLEHLSAPERAKPSYDSTSPVGNFHIVSSPWKEYKFVQC